eukprot:7266849-Lingulodinium_polyedra.AAC.1
MHQHCATPELCISITHTFQTNRVPATWQRTGRALMATGRPVAIAIPAGCSTRGDENMYYRCGCTRRLVEQREEIRRCRATQNN